MRREAHPWPDVQDAPAISQLAQQPKPLIDGRLVAIYNAGFDTRILRQSFKADSAAGQYLWL